MTTTQSPSATMIDANEVRWAAEAVAQILRKAEPDSVVGAILQQTLRELSSLNPTAATVIGPFRMRIAA